MERYRLTPSFNGAPPLQKPNFLSSVPSQTSLPLKPYLNDSLIFPYRRPEPPKLASDRRGRSTDDAELGIFDAERYFNEVEDSGESTKKVTITLSTVNGSGNLSSNPRDFVLPGDPFAGKFRNLEVDATTPTASSETSWNSQTGLLKNPARALSVSVKSFPVDEQRKRSTSTGRRHFFHLCPCSSKKSVDVKEKYDEPKCPIPSSCGMNNSSGITADGAVERMTKVEVLPGIWPRDSEIFPLPATGLLSFNSGGFSFPALPPRKEEDEEDPARDSLEVFRPGEAMSSLGLRKSAEYPKRSTPVFPFAGDNGNRRGYTFPGSPMTRPAAEEDAASDTSADLFEIESLSTHMTYRRRDSLDELSPSVLFDPKKMAGSAAGISQLRLIMEEGAAAASEGYPPSEVSVQWSVTTAEGFDRASVANFSSAVSVYDAAVGGGKNKVSAGGGLLGCRSEKAVCVSEPEPVRLGRGGSVSANEADRIAGQGVGRVGRAAWWCEPGLQ
ncbi:Protein phytochrome kinase substrate 4 [Apostasia shenzhenica]|uniref:Protein phytochrome kinase substrate 4 n=1 Tax=Apostasia shenzhenica TaxID=1088818 RepID=A0A2I0BGP8_9ASPA|nr:Protein phytochrome kinase substrate 4 [Apostasia shenzhenica]